MPVLGYNKFFDKSTNFSAKAISDNAINLDLQNKAISDKSENKKLYFYYLYVFKTPFLRFKHHIRTFTTSVVHPENVRGGI